MRTVQERHDVLREWPKAFQPPVQALVKEAGRHPANRADGSPTLTVQVLDGFHVWKGAHELDSLPCGKLGSLLKLLVLERRRPLTRARLCALYWPEADATDARNCLNVSICKLRRWLGGAAQIRYSDETYQLLVDGEVWLDAEQFEWLADQAQAHERNGQLDAAIEAYAAAAELYQSDLSPDPDADAALGHRVQALRGRLNLVLARLSALCENTADYHRCLRTSLRSLTLDECNEAAHRHLMRCYAGLHQPQGVERQYRQCVTLLRQLLGVAPSEETTALYRSLAVRIAA